MAERIPAPDWRVNWLFLVVAECACGRTFRTRERYERHWLDVHGGSDR